MKILFLTDNYPPEVNAAASRVHERAKHWIAKGYEVTVITSSPNFPQGKVYKDYKNKWRYVEVKDGIRIVRVKTFIARNKGTLLRMCDFLSYMFTSFVNGLFEKKPDIICATSPHLFTAVSGYLLSVFKRKPFIFEVADLWPDSIKAVGAISQSKILKLVEKLELFLYRHATNIVVLSPAFKDNLVSRGIASNKIHVIINGVEQSQFYPKAADVELQKKLSLTGKYVIGYIGTFGMAHALSSVIEAAKLLRGHDNIRFLFVGDGAERELIQSKANDEGVTNVVFVPPKPKVEIINYWALCDVALVHLRDSPVFETVIPSKIFEAMAMHLPVVLACPKGVASTIISKEAVGVCVSPEQPQALADAVKALFDDADLTKKMSTASAAAVSSYTREAQAFAWEALFRQIKSENGS